MDLEILFTFIAFYSLLINLNILIITWFKLSTDKIDFVKYMKDPSRGIPRFLIGIFLEDLILFLSFSYLRKFFNNDISIIIIGLIFIFWHFRFYRISREIWLFLFFGINAFFIAFINLYCFVNLNNYLLYFTMHPILAYIIEYQLIREKN